MQGFGGLSGVLGFRVVGGAGLPALSPRRKFGP